MPPDTIRQYSRAIHFTYSRRTICYFSPPAGLRLLFTGYRAGKLLADLGFQQRYVSRATRKRRSFPVISAGTT